jgi:hypothetical protein
VTPLPLGESYNLRRGWVPTVEKNFTKSQFYLIKRKGWLFKFDVSHIEVVEEPMNVELLQVKSLAT